MCQMKLLPCTSSYDGNQCLHIAIQDSMYMQNTEGQTTALASFSRPPAFIQLNRVLGTLNLAARQTACDVIGLNKVSLYSLLGLLLTLTLRASKQDFECVTFTVHPTRARTLTNKPLCTSQRSNVCVPHKACHTPKSKPSLSSPLLSV